MSSIALTHRSPIPRALTRHLPRLSRGAGFWAVAFSFFVLTAFATAPSALYGLYAQQEGLSPLTVTIVYAVYATGVVVSLVLAGHVSDWYGRRAVLIPGLVLGAVAALLFIVWQSLAGLLAARVLSSRRRPNRDHRHAYLKGVRGARGRCAPPATRGSDCGRTASAGRAGGA